MTGQRRHGVMRRLAASLLLLAIPVTLAAVWHLWEWVGEKCPPNEMLDRGRHQQPTPRLNSVVRRYGALVLLR